MNQNIKIAEALGLSASPKEKAMFDAVLEMINEHYNFSQIKVSDITSRAGIGKGTAYEYFSSKEEIVIKAILYGAYSNMKKVESTLMGEGFFDVKFYRILDFMEDNMDQLNSISELLRGKCDDIHKKLSMDEGMFTMIRDGMQEYVNGIADRFMKQGLEEKFFIQENQILCRNALYTAVMGYFIFMANSYYNKEITREDARQYTFKGMIATLSFS